MDGAEGNDPCTTTHETRKRQKDIHTISKEPKSVAGSHQPQNDTSDCQASAAKIQIIYG
jgi:hypothetical protein